MSDGVLRYWVGLGLATSGAAMLLPKPEPVSRMAFAAYWSRMSLRHRLRGLIDISLILGLVGGLCLLTLAGARRTQSAWS